MPCIVADLTMKRVITGILAMLIVLPSLEITSGINGSETSLALGGLHMLHTQALVGGTNSTAFASSLQVRQLGATPAARANAIPTAECPMPAAYGWQICC